jgi:5-methyltetrahydrofolate--homocysteine methyltransferase
MRGLRERLAAGEVLVGDGAWGTQLMARGLAPGESPEAFGLAHPEVLAEIAARYLEAGAELLTTNTFGGSPLRLAAHGLEDRCVEINRRAVEAVRPAAAGRAYVSGSVGPCGAILRPYGEAEPELVAAGFRRQIGALIAAGADLICVETMIDLAEARLAIAAARTFSAEIPILATMTVDATPRGFFTTMGTSVAEACAGLADTGADAVGSNCGNGIAAMVEIARAFADHSTLPIAIQSNAGLPEHRDGALVWPETPADFAARVPELLDLGVRIIGGCCGTGPEHVRAIREAVEARGRIGAPLRNL